MKIKKAKTWNQVRLETQRRTQEDSCCRMIYTNQYGQMCVCLTEDFVDTHLECMPVAFVWRDAIEMINQKGRK